MSENERTLFDRLQQRYPWPEWVTLAQVRNGTGYVKRVTRTSDAIAMNTWPSRGLVIHGFEFKVSRGDWLRELKAPEKADEIAANCDYWWVVAAEKEIVAAGELPHGWGLLVPKGKGLGVVTEALPMCCEAVREQLLDRPFVAAILRQVRQQITQPAVLKAEFDRGREEGVAVGEEHGADKLKWEHEAHERLRLRVKDFEKASGIELSSGYWATADHLGDAVRRVLAGDDQRVRENLERLRESAQRIVESIDHDLAQVTT